MAHLGICVQLPFGYLWNIMEWYGFYSLAWLVLYVGIWTHMKLDAMHKGCGSNLFKVRTTVRCQLSTNRIGTANIDSEEIDFDMKWCEHTYIYIIELYRYLRYPTRYFLETSSQTHAQVIWDGRGMLGGTRIWLFQGSLGYFRGSVTDRSVCLVLSCID